MAEEEEIDEAQTEGGEEEQEGGEGATGAGMSIERIEQFVEENRNMVMVAGGVVLAIIVGLIYLFAKYLPDENVKAQKAMYIAEFNFAKDSFALALNGNAAYSGFADVASKYKWTRAGNLADYYAGICCLNIKRYNDAISYLDKFSTSDPIIGAIKLSATGDAYSEIGKMDEAVKYYQKAADFSDNESYTPYFLFKAGLAYEHQKNLEEAKKCFEKIHDKYPNSDEGRDIEKYIARVGGSSK